MELELLAVFSFIIICTNFIVEFSLFHLNSVFDGFGKYLLEKNFLVGCKMSYNNGSPGGFNVK